MAQEAGAQVIPMAAGVGVVRGAETNIDAIDYNVKILTKVARKERRLA